MACAECNFNVDGYAWPEVPLCTVRRANMGSSDHGAVCRARNQNESFGCVPTGLRNVGYCAAKSCLPPGCLGYEH